MLNGVSFSIATENWLKTGAAGGVASTEPPDGRGKTCSCPASLLAATTLQQGGLSSVAVPSSLAFAQHGREGCEEQQSAAKAGRPIAMTALTAIAAPIRRIGRMMPSGSIAGNPFNLNHSPGAYTVPLSELSWPLDPGTGSRVQDPRHADFLPRGRACRSRRHQYGQPALLRAQGVAAFAAEEQEQLPAIPARRA